jgi:hypothetical protein
VFNPSNGSEAVDEKEVLVSSGTVGFGSLTAPRNFVKIRCLILLDLWPEVLVANL